MYYLSFDIANKSLAISFLCFNKNYKNDIFKLKIQDNTIESYMNEMKNLNDELNKIFVYYIYEVVDLIPQQKVRETTVVQRSNKLKEYLNLDDDIIPINNIIQNLKNNQ